ncbi:hypothetical protein VTN02DRAFT_4574 [Thermoascus thermophilus]
MLQPGRTRLEQFSCLVRIAAPKKATSTTVQSSAPGRANLTWGMGRYGPSRMQRTRGRPHQKDQSWTEPYHPSNSSLFCRPVSILGNRPRGDSFLTASTRFRRGRGGFSITHRPEGAPFRLSGSTPHEFWGFPPSPPPRCLAPGLRCSRER